MNPYEKNSIEKIVAHLKAGELVAIPTETVYGLVADASQPKAIEKIFALKHRPHDRPLSVLIADKNQIKNWATHISKEAIRLAEVFWPGPLTLVLPKAPQVSTLLTANKDSIGLRVPAHPVALEILKNFDGGLAAPSANLFGQKSPQTAEEVATYFSDDLWIVDAGKANYGMASTVVDCTVSPLKILREGVISEKELLAVL